MSGGKLIRRLAEYLSDGWRREGLIDSSCLFKIGAEVRAVRWKISNNTHPVPVLNNTHPFPSKCSVDALCRVRESVRFASERSRVRIPPGQPSLNLDAACVPGSFFPFCFAARVLIAHLFCNSEIIKKAVKSTISRLFCII